MLLFFLLLFCFVLSFFAYFFSYIAAQWENCDFLMKMGQKKSIFQKCQKMFWVGGLKVGR